MKLFAKLLEKFRAKPIYQDDWQTYLKNVDKKVSTVAVDLNFSQNKGITTRENVISLSIQLLNPSTNGLAIKEEESELWKIEDALVLAFYKNQLNLSFAGHLTANNLRTLYFYTDNTTVIEKVISEIMLKYPTYVYEYKCEKDGLQQIYFDKLYPTPKIMQQIKNKKVLYVLSENGDDLSKERAVSHWIYFGEMKNLEIFELFCQNLNFETLVKEKVPAEDKNYTYKLVVSRIDKVTYDVIDGYTLPLWEKANELDGIYDGWETSVEK
ncbi:MAG: DUF695 domain-containing protein [Chitinophagales bacterium]